MRRNNPHAIFAANAVNASEGDSTAQSIANGIYVGVGLFFIKIILGAVLSALFGVTAAATITLLLEVLLLIAYLFLVVSRHRDPGAPPVPMALVLGFILVWFVCADVFALLGERAGAIAWLVGIAVLVAAGVAGKVVRRTR